MSTTSPTTPDLAKEVAGLRRVMMKLLDRLGPPIPDGDLTINEWCRKRKISRAKFYLMKKAGTAPHVTEHDGLLRITPEADKAWEAARRAEVVP